MPKLSSGLLKEKKQVDEAATEAAPAAEDGVGTKKGLVIAMAMQRTGAGIEAGVKGDAAEHGGEAAQVAAPASAGDLNA